MSPRRVALVTGGTRGIGRGIATSLAQDGFDVFLCGRRAASEVAGVVSDLEAFGGGVGYAVADVGNTTERDALLDAVRDRFGRLDVLVNNAGMTSLDRDRDLLDAREASFERLLRVNLQGPYFLTRAAARWMIEQRDAVAGFSGCIVNVSSISATTVSVNRGDYCVSKAGLGMATQVWATRLAEYGIGVYEIRPGLILSDMSAPAREKYDRLIAEGLLLEPRWGTPEDVGRAVATLVRGDLPYASGQVLTLDGGLSIPRL